MAHLFELREDQIKRVRPFFPKESVVPVWMTKRC